MEAIVYLDTHVVAWLYGKQLDRLSARARDAIENNDLLISPMVELELAYLQEVGRLRASPRAVVNDLLQRIGLQVCDLPFPQVIESALSQRWTRDPFDRVIVAQALLAERRLVTKDETIHKHFAPAIW